MKDEINSIQRDDNFIVGVDTSRLTDREYFILMKRWNFEEKPLTLEEIGNLLGVSKQRIDQKMTRIFKKLNFRKVIDK